MVDYLFNDFDWKHVTDEYCIWCSVWDALAVCAGFCIGAVLLGCGFVIMSALLAYRDARRERKQFNILDGN